MGPQTARTPSGSKLVGRQPRGEACPGPTASHAPRAEGALLRPTIRDPRVHLTLFHGAC